MSDFIEVARLDEVPPGRGTTVTVAGKDVARLRRGDLPSEDPGRQDHGRSGCATTGTRIRGVQTEWNQAVM